MCLGNHQKRVRRRIYQIYARLLQAVKIGKGRFINRPSKTGGKKYDRFFVYVPTYVATDENFPFKPGEEVLVRIENGKVVIEKG